MISSRVATGAMPVMLPGTTISADVNAVNGSPNVTPALASIACSLRLHVFHPSDHCAGSRHSRSLDGEFIAMPTATHLRRAR